MEYPEITKEMEAKLEALILYVGNRCETNRGLVDLVVSEVAIAIDATSFRRYGRAITRIPYLKKSSGIAPLYLKRILADMESKRTIVLKNNGMFGLKYRQHRIITLLPANLDCFISQDIAVIEDILYQSLLDGGAAIKATAYGTVWRLAQYGDLIPYESFYLADSQVSSLCNGGSVNAQRSGRPPSSPTGFQ